jgi:hypothetical protein
MILTIVADASFCPNTRAAAWGGCVILDGPRRRAAFFSGPLIASSNNSAERKGVIAAVEASVAAGYVHRKDDLLIVNDCQGACYHLESSISKRDRWRIANGLPLPVRNDGELEGPRFQLTRLSKTVGFRFAIAYSPRKDHGPYRWAICACDRIARRRMRE